MKQKGRFLFLFILTTLAVCLFFSSCEKEPPHEHSYERGWTSDGENHWHAAMCEHTEQVWGFGEHEWNRGKVTTPATEEENGEKTYTCTVCGATKTEVIAALGHTHTFATTLSFDAEGHYYAATCGHTEERKDFTAHSYTVTVTPPTCEEDGFTAHTCACGYRYTDTPIPALHHDYTLLTPNGDGTHTATCRNNAEHTEQKTCTPAGEGAVTPPTCEEDGYTTYTCACGYEWTDNIVAALDHTFGKDGTCGTCGEKRTIKLTFAGNGIGDIRPNEKEYHVTVLKESDGSAEWSQIMSFLPAHHSSALYITAKDGSTLTNKTVAAVLLENGQPLPAARYSICYYQGALIISWSEYSLPV